MTRLLLKVLFFAAVIAGVLAFTIGVPLGTKTGTAQSGTQTFGYEVDQKLRLTPAGAQLNLTLRSAELVDFLFAEFAATDIHRKLRDQQVKDVVFSSKNTARVTGQATLRLNKYITSKLRFTADLNIAHDDRSLIVTYAFDFKDFPDALEREFTRRVPMDKRLRRDCMKIDDVTLVQDSRHEIRVAATCQWAEIF